ncbi:unnamed protein product [Parnassius mnemosyne]|uniref:Reverse transcriptase domain-containing protein n=1 Tax=Parnassius mnemosyne TaxID=213953 RepID=A0AAV1KEF8_9NEOP
MSGHRALDCRKRREVPVTRATTKTAEQHVKVQVYPRPVTGYVCGQQGHVASACPDRQKSDEKPAVSNVHLRERKPAIGTFTTSTGELVSFLFDSGSACSLVTSDLASRLPGTMRNELVYIAGIGDDNVVTCDLQILSPINVEGTQLDVLFNVVPNTAISEPVIIGRGILDKSVIVEISNERIQFSLRREVDIVGKSSQYDFTNIDTDLQGFMRIELVDPNKTVHRRPYRLSPAEKEIVRDKIRHLLEAGVIHESTSPFASSILLVKKKDNSDKMCVDFRELNANTRPEHYPLPIIDEQIDRLHGARYFSSLDMASGYHQTPMDLEGDNIARTAFVTPEGQYEFLAMPFGLRSAASVY